MIRVLRGLTGFLFGFTIAICGGLAMMPRAHGAEPPATDLPKEQPVTATGFICQRGNGQKGVVAIVFTYPSGVVVRVDLEHMHGLADAQELTHYASSAKDQSVYVVACLDPAIV